MLGNGYMYPKSIFPLTYVVGWLGWLVWLAQAHFLRKILLEFTNLMLFFF
jgi:hypothetical protein